MGKQTGFLDYTRKDPSKRSIQDRIQDYKEIESRLSLDELQDQAARCMDCGVPSCHAYGCPVSNRIPDFNEMIYRGKWKLALEILHSTNNFPEVTGRVCPAPCEAACTLAINQPAVTIKHIELQIVERGFDEGWIVPQTLEEKTGKRVAVVGSGPAGLSVSQQLARKGHDVFLFERDEKIGGLLRYGIPDFKMEKWILDRRMEQMEAEGVRFETEVNVGVDISPRFLKRSYDAIVLTNGATAPRDLDIPGRDLKGIYFAMQFLSQQNKRIAGIPLKENEIVATGKDVIVIGGGDTGSDCVGTSRRQGAKSITQIELLPKPPVDREAKNPWPEWPNVMRTSTSHEEGCERSWSILTQSFEGKEGHVQKIKCVELQWSQPDENGRRNYKEIKGSEFEIKADLVLLATGFVHVEHGPLVKDYDLDIDNRGNIVIDENGMTSEQGVFAAGDAAQGASLVVRAINQGREVADGVHQYLMK